MKKDAERNRREFERIPADQNICFLDPGSGRHCARLRDLSPEGMLLETEASAPVPPRLQVILFTGKELLTLPADVVRVNKKDDTHVGVGVKVALASAQYTQFVINRALRGG